MVYTVTRKGDREKMAAFFQGQWEAAPGFTANRLDPAPVWPGERCILLELRGPRGVGVSLHLNGNSSQPDTYVLSWRVATDSDARFAWNFAGSRNEVHKRKATDIAEGFHALWTLLSDRMTKLQSGEAFEADA